MPPFNPALIGAPSPVGRGGGGQNSFRRIIAAQIGGDVSGLASLIAPIDGTYRLAIVGAGGQGGFSGTTGNCVMSGGGSGGLAVSKPFKLAANQSISVNIGAAYPLFNSQTSDGGQGGASSATLADGTLMTATGGKGGFGRQNNSFYAGGDGGIGSGGEFNFPGISGGSAGTSGSSLVGNQCGVETFIIGAAVITPARVRSFGTFHQTNQVAVGGGANSPTGGFCPGLVGTNGVMVGSDSPPSTNQIGVGTGGYWFNNGNNQIRSPKAGDGGAYLILEV